MAALRDYRAAMKILTITGVALTLAGVLLIAFARPLGALYEGGTVTMSDLGFIVYGVAAIGLGLLLLIIAMIVRLMQRRNPTRPTEHPLSAVRRRKGMLRTRP